MHVTIFKFNDNSLIIHSSILIQPIMVFHGANGGQPSGKKKTTVGYRRKQGNSFRAYQETISNTVAVAAPSDEAADPNPAVEPMDGPPCPASNKRKDDNWRTTERPSQSLPDRKLLLLVQGPHLGGGQIAGWREGARATSRRWPDRRLLLLGQERISEVARS